MPAWYDRVFAPSDTLSNEETTAGLDRIVRDGMASQAMASLTGSAFLAAFAIKLGASNATIGLLAAIPHLSQLLQLPAISIVDRLRNRRFLSVASSGIGRSAWIVVAAAPFFLNDHAALVTLAVCLVVASTMAAVSNAGWNSWVHELVPHDELGSFFGRRFSMATATGMVLSLAGAVFVDRLAPEFLTRDVYAYSVLFSLGFVFGLLGVAIIARIPEPRYQPLATSLTESLRTPLRDENFVNLIRFLGSWNLAMYLATPFFVVYMLRRLELSLALVVGLIVLGRLVNILFLRVWGEFSDRRSNKAVLSVSCPLCLLCVFGWTFTSLPEKHLFTIPLLVALHIAMGIAMAGITLASGNIGLKLAPRGMGTGYLASVNFVAAAAAGLGPLLAGNLVDFFVSRELSWTMNWSSGEHGLVAIDILNLQQWDFIFVVSALAGLYALHRLAFVKEVGEQDERIDIMELLNAAGRELRDFSTVATIRNIRSIAVTPFKSASSRSHMNGPVESSSPKPAE